MPDTRINNCSNIAGVSVPEVEASVEIDSSAGTELDMEEDELDELLVGVAAVAVDVELSADDAAPDEPVSFVGAELDTEEDELDELFDDVAAVTVDVELGADDAAPDKPGSFAGAELDAGESDDATPPEPVKDGKLQGRPIFHLPFASNTAP